VLRALGILLVAALLAGCGGDEPGGEPLTLALDFTPNAVHAPLFAAADKGAFEIREPGSGPDALKLVASGRAQLGVLDIHDLAIAQARGSDIVAVAALVDRPLAALAARPPVTRPRDLEGRTVGVSGLPSDPAFLRAIVSADGGDPAQVRQVTIGFSAVTRILSGRVDAAPVFWNAEGVVLRERGLDLREFRVDDYGAPAYPEVVLITSRETLETRRADLRAALQAIDAGVAEVRADPAAAAERVAQAAQADDVDLVRAQLDAVSPLYGMPLDRKRLEAWARFDARIGIVRSVPDIDAAFDFSLGKDLAARAS
jgi:putative hydroxymethylpyrimidine transport system substrate-binding protein